MRASLWVVAVALLFAASVDAGRRKPKRREPAPEVMAQLLEQRLTDETLSADERARLSVRLAQNLYQLRQFVAEGDVLENALAAGITNTNLAAQAHYYLGRTYEALGANDQATEQFDTVWQQCAGSRYQLLAGMELGDLTLLSSNTDAAVEWYEAVRDLGGKARVAFLARDKLRAISHGANAEEITDESHRPVYLKDRFRRLDQYLFSQLYDKADSLAQELLASATNTQIRAAMNYHLAHHYWMYGNVEGADQFVANAVQTAGDRHVKALILAGHIERALGQTDAALGYYQQAIAAAPAKQITITAYQQSTRLLSKSGNDTQALALAAAGRRAFTGKPEYAAYLDRMASTLRDRANPQWTNYAAQVAMTSTNQLARRALQQLAKEARRRGDWARAEQLSQQLVARGSPNWQANIDAVMRVLEAQLQRTNFVRAAVTETNLLAAVAAMPSDDAKSYILYRLGKIWLANSNAPIAEARWQRVLTAYPATDRAGMAQVQLARLYEERADLANSVAMYETYLRHAETPSLFKLHACARLVRLKQALGDPIASSSLLDNAKTLALQTNDPELQLHLAQYFLRHSDQAMAKQLLDLGIQNADATIPTIKNPQKRLWWQYLIVRRLDEFEEFGRVADRAANMEPGLLQNPMVDATMRNAMYCFLMRGLEKSGRWSEAEALCQQAIQATPEDSLRLGHLLYRLSYQAQNRGEPTRARQFALDAFREVPTSWISQHMYLDLAADDFNTGQYTNALAKIAELERAVPVTRIGPKFYAQSFRWNCQYVKGRCLIALGNATAGQRLVAEAVAQKSYVAQMCDLREPSTPAP
jgi:tetratricopeptide (TPR) repeat protein